MKITKKILSEEQIQERIIKLASEINTDYEGKNLIILGVLKGAFIAISDLAKNLNIDVSFEFMSISSYEGSESTGQIKIEKDLDIDISGKNILIVEDIFDNLLLKCSWQRWYVCRACIGSELLYFCTRSCFFDVVLGFLQVYTINQKYQRDLMYVLQSYVVEPASVRSESNSFFSSLLQHAHTSTCTGAFLSIVPFA